MMLEVLVQYAYYCGHSLESSERVVPHVDTMYNWVANLHDVSSSTMMLA